MSDLDTMIALASVEVNNHTEAQLRQRVAALLSPEVQRLLDLRFHEKPAAVVIACLGVPCSVEAAPDGAPVWQFACPWWHSIVPEDQLFESRLLAEIGKAKLHVDGMLAKLDPAKMN